MINDDRFTVLVANAKGGCGKTTLSTNLASYYACRGFTTSLLDLDQQYSSRWWLKQRDSQLPPIQSLIIPEGSSFSASILSLAISQARQRLIIDSPAGLDRHTLNQLLRQADAVLIPILPSEIDIHAVTRFLQTIILTPSYRQKPSRLAVVANRARLQTKAYNDLKRFLSSLGIPFLATVRETQRLVHAFAEGKGILELPYPDDRDAESWDTIIRWLELQRLLPASDMS